jgi:hypothetical protein
MTHHHACFAPVVNRVREHLGRRVSAADVSTNLIRRLEAREHLPDQHANLWHFARVAFELTAAGALSRCLVYFDVVCW